MNSVAISPDQGDIELAAPEGMKSLVDVSKQVVTLATAIITVTIAFSKDIVGAANLSAGDKWLVGGAWGLLVVSILAGVWCMYAATASIEKGDSGSSVSVYDTNVAIPMGVQQVAFALALVLIVIFGVSAL